MHKILLSFLFVALLGTVFVNSASAWSLPPAGPSLNDIGSLLSSSGAPHNAPVKNYTEITAAFISLLLLIAIVIGLFFLVWGGFNWITSSGDKQKVQNARNRIIYSILGLIVAFVSYFIINIILNFFKIS